MGLIHEIQIIIVKKNIYLNNHFHCISEKQNKDWRIIVHYPMMRSRKVKELSPQFQSCPRLRETIPTTTRIVQFGLRKLIIVTKAYIMWSKNVMRFATILVTRSTKANRKRVDFTAIFDQRKTENSKIVLCTNWWWILQTRWMHIYRARKRAQEGRDNMHEKLLLVELVFGTLLHQIKYKHHIRKREIQVIIHLAQWNCPLLK